jgi:hypothetical protein
MLAVSPTCSTSNRSRQPAHFSNRNHVQARTLKPRLRGGSKSRDTSAERLAEAGRVSNPFLKCTTEGLESDAGLERRTFPHCPNRQPLTASLRTTSPVKHDTIASSQDLCADRGEVPFDSAHPAVLDHSSDDSPLVRPSPVRASELAAR